MKRRDIFLAGVLSTLIISVAMFLMRLIWGIPSLPETLLDRSTLFIPLSIYKVFILKLGALAKPVFIIFFILLQLAGGGVLALLWIPAQEKLFPGIGTGLAKGKTGATLLRSGLAGFMFCAFLWLVIMLAFFPLMGLGLLGRSLGPGPAVMSLVVAVLLLLYALSLSFLNSLTLGSGLQAPDSHRRRLIKRLSLGMLAVVLTGSLAALMKALLKSQEVRTIPAQAPSAGTPSPKTIALTSEITANDVFYSVSKNFVDPEVDGAKWKLEVDGKVGRPLTFSLEELKRLPALEEYRTLECISNEVGGDLIGNARWKGVPLRFFLEQASVAGNAKKLVFHGADDYSDSITLERAMNPANLLAYEMNGVTLPDRHGFPARLLIPGIYGMKNVKWLTRIEVVDYDYKGYWQERGWSDSADIVIMSRIDTPMNNDSYRAGEVPSISGIAFAGGQGINRVEVSQDEGKSWAPAELKEALGPYTWVLWVYNWEPAPGRYTLLVRAADKKGLLQESREQEPFPDGATGYHRVTVRIA